ncbi:DUF447 domain-containing protein [Halobacterium noricense]|uniref:DUF447 domain-containing protein n=1 Tax=Halobacterium noricense TaxID=223182 RepID=UPI001E5F15C3|nr:DUF447 domain-containing protein [Halobacterium noricense]UHH24529.1 DUF447 family protein [Halobacterium noricense]
MAEWPVALRGTTETVVTTRGPNDLWNVAALGVQAPAGAERASGDAREPRAAPEDGGAVTATTWGNTRTRRNFHREGGGYVQFVADPVVFVDAALSIREEPSPVLDAADAWVEVEAEHVDTDEDDDTRREHWELHPVESEVVRASPPTINRGFNAVVEATVAASRLDVPAYDTETLRERLRFFEDVARKCGGEREREAIQRVCEHVDGEW